LGSVQQYLNTLMFLGSIAALYALLYLMKKLKPEILKKYGISLEGPIILVKTEKFNKIIEDIGNKFRKPIQMTSYISIIVGLYLMFIGIHFIHSNLIAIIFRSPTATPVEPILPGVNIGLDALPYMVFAAAVVLLPHELAHGIAASAFKVRIKSSGLLLALVLFGGFVEPEEEELKKTPLLKKIGFFSVGSFTNFLTFLLVAQLFASLMVPSGVLVRETLKGYPANRILEVNDVIIEINGTSISTLDDLITFMKTTKPGDNIVMTVMREGKMRELLLTLAEDPRNSSKGFMGARFDYYYQPVFFSKIFNGFIQRFAIEVYKIFKWVYLLTVSVAVMNMLPIYPFDGGRIIYAILEKSFKDENKINILKISVTLYFTIVLFANIILSIRIWGLGSWLP